MDTEQEDSGRMAFERDEGLVDVRFTQGDFDWLFVHLRLVPEVTRVTHLDDGFEPLRTETSAPPIVEVSCRMAGVYCPLRDMLAWLEALTLGVPECAWSIDGEGPWHRIAVDHTALVVEGSAAPDGGARIRVNRRQLVQAFYEGFRSFAQSPGYEPERYEVGPRALLQDAVPLADLRSPIVEKWVERTFTTGVRWLAAPSPAKLLIEAAAFAGEQVRGRVCEAAAAAPGIDRALERARVLATEGAVEDVGVLCAALLHGILEGTRTTDGDVKERFGEPVAGIVRELCAWARAGALPYGAAARGCAAELSRGARLVLLSDVICRQRELAGTAREDTGVSSTLFDAGQELEQLVGEVRGTHALLEHVFDTDRERAIGGDRGIV